MCVLPSVHWFGSNVLLAPLTSCQPRSSRQGSHYYIENVCERLPTVRERAGRTKWSGPVVIPNFLNGRCHQSFGVRGRKVGEPRVSTTAVPPKTGPPKGSLVLISHIPSYCNRFTGSPANLVEQLGLPTGRSSLQPLCPPGSL